MCPDKAPSCYSDSPTDSIASSEPKVHVIQSSAGTRKLLRSGNVRLRMRDYLIRRSRAWDSREHG